MTHKVYVMSSGRQVERVLGLSILWGSIFSRITTLVSIFLCFRWLRFESWDNNHCGFPPFWHLTFRQESFWHKCFIMGTFWHMDHSALRMYRHRDVSTWEHFDIGKFHTGNFRHEEFSAQEHFGTRIFWHKDISTHVYFGTDILAQVPCPCVKMSLHQKFSMSNHARAETFMYRNGRSNKWCTCRNVPVMKHPCPNDPYQNVLYQNGVDNIAAL